MINFFKKHYLHIIQITLLILGIFYLSQMYAVENEHAQWHINLNYHKALVYENCFTNDQKRQFHKENSVRCLQDAKDCCWYLPTLSKREKARQCFTSLGIMLVPAEPKARIISALVSALIQYGVNCSDEWHYINEKLYWAQYHADMSEHYSDLIAYGYL